MGWRHRPPASKRDEDGTVNQYKGQPGHRAPPPLRSLEKSTSQHSHSVRLRSPPHSLSAASSGGENKHANFNQRGCCWPRERFWIQANCGLTSPTGHSRRAVALLRDRGINIFSTNPLLLLRWANKAVADFDHQRVNAQFIPISPSPGPAFDQITPFFLGSFSLFADSPDHGCGPSTSHHAIHTYIAKP